MDADRLPDINATLMWSVLKDFLSLSPNPDQYKLVFGEESPRRPVLVSIKEIHTELYDFDELNSGEHSYAAYHKNLMDRNVAILAGVLGALLSVLAFILCNLCFLVCCFRRDIARFVDSAKNSLRDVFIAWDLWMTYQGMDYPWSQTQLELAETVNVNLMSEVAEELNTRRIRKKSMQEQPTKYFVGTSNAVNRTTRRLATTKKRRKAKVKPLRLMVSSKAFNVDENKEEVATVVI